MKNYSIWLACLCLVSGLALGQNNVAIGDTYALPHASASLELQSTNKGFLLNRLTTQQRDSIQNPALSLMIFNTTNDRYEYFDGFEWAPFIHQDLRLIPWSPLLNGKYPVENITSDKELLIGVNPGGKMYIVLPYWKMQSRNINADWNLATNISSAVVVDSSLYILFKNSGSNITYKLYRYNLYNIQDGGTEVVLLGRQILATPSSYKIFLTMSNGIMYVNYDGGYSTNDYVIARYVITDPLHCTYQNSISFGATLNSFRRILVNDQQEVIGLGESSVSSVVFYTDTGVFIRSSGELQFTAADHIMVFQNKFFFSRNGTGFYMRIWLE